MSICNKNLIFCVLISEKEIVETSLVVKDTSLRPGSPKIFFFDTLRFYYFFKQLYDKY